MVNIEEIKDNAMEALLGDELINSKPGSKPLSTAKALAEKDLVLLYFSAGTFWLVLAPDTNRPRHHHLTRKISHSFPIN